MTRLIIILKLLFVAYSSFGQSRTLGDKPGCCTSKYSTKERDTLNIQKLGTEYRRLKAAKCERCNSSGADFVAVMDLLGERLNGKTKKEIFKVMGKPDEKWSDTCVYFWRGEHDYLYFNFPQGKAVSQWYYAYE